VNFHRKVSRDFRNRQKVVLALFFSMSLVLIWGAIDLQINEPVDLKKRADSRSLRLKEIPTDRGIIFDKNKDPLAVSVPHYALEVDPRKLINDEVNQNKIARILDWDRKKLQQIIFTKKNKKGIPLTRKLSEEQRKALSDLGIDGLYFTEYSKRHYPTSNVTAHLIGFTDRDDRGQEGVEKLYNTTLRGVAGERRVLQDARRQVVKSLQIIKPVEPGRDLYLTIHAGVQYAAYRALEKAVTNNQATSGSVVVMNPNNGDVLALTNYPSFNPNISSEKQAHLYRNRAVTDKFEPGSTLKPFTIAMALEAARYAPDSIIDTSPGAIQIGRNKVQDPKDYGILNLTGILKHSSNVGSTKIAFDHPPQAMWNILWAVGFGEKTGLKLNGEARGDLISHVNWHPFDHAIHSFGYGMTVTAVQLARAYSVIANGGELVSLRIAQGSPSFPTVRAIKKTTAQSILSMLTVAVNEGTGKNARVQGFSVAGKTGTARKLLDGEYTSKAHMALFAGIIPADAPRLVGIVVIDEPHGEQYTGGQVAAPVFSEIMNEATRLLNIQPGSGDNRSAIENFATIRTPPGSTF
jgi:cell division protein FtsI (penicillin-binding protein 3)